VALKVLVKAPLNAQSGYGSDGIGITRALLNAGLDVYLDPPFAVPPLPADIAALFTKRLEAPFDLVIQHVDPAQLELTDQARRAASVAVGWTMWEYTTLDNAPKRRGLKKRLQNFDIVFGYDAVTTGALAPYAGKVELGVLQGGFWPTDWSAVRRDWHSKRFGFCMTGQLHQRKDPFVAIQAFQELKEEHPTEFEPAELHLKTNVPGLHSAMEHVIPKLRIHYATWPQEVLREFYAAQHVLLAPSRGEGKNLPALEFQATGGAVIATNWGGHCQWLSKEYAYPLDFSLAPIDGSQPNCMNARADKDHLKALMLHVFRNRDEVARKAAIAAEVIPQMCNWDAVIDRLFHKVADLAPARGAAILDQFRRTREMTRDMNRNGRFTGTLGGPVRAGSRA
jgi:glycosyltransferase involved in cell wall biosynthesis